MIKEIQIKNFRCFENIKIPFKDLSVIIGKNNAGKSTIIEALRIISLITNKYKSLSYKDTPSWLEFPQIYKAVYPSLRNVDFNFKTAIHRYGNPPALISVKFTSGAYIDVYITSDNIFALIFDDERNPINSKSKASSIDIPLVSILPQIGPLLKEEKVRSEEYVIASMDSSLTSLHFRNQIMILNKSYKQFKSLAEESWKGLKLVEFNTGKKISDDITLLVQDGDFTAEVGWMGNGLQMWLQIMWFLSRIPTNSTVILDEPDVYMHPDLQRKIIRLLKSKYDQSIIATHSVEIIAEVDPEDILMVDKKKRIATYANSLPAVQKIIDNIGGVHNLHLARLGSTRKCVFVEGKDMSYLNEAYKKIYPEYDESFLAIPNMPIGGWANWPYAVGSSMFLKNESGEMIKAYCILDRDYHTSNEIDNRLKEAKRKGIDLHIWSQKEIENYFIIPDVIYRLIKLKSKEEIAKSDIIQQINNIIEEQKDVVFDALSEQLRQINKEGGVSTANKEARRIINEKWNTFENKLSLVSGKEVLARLSNWCQSKYQVHLSFKSILKEIKKNELPEEVVKVISTIKENGSLL